ncbi:MAG: hypothetical protein J6A75_11980 [Lachnospiraceae bacterium]|nr:hypothetical protein [Lachnospiraceae bacterium]
MRERIKVPKVHRLIFLLAATGIALAFSYCLYANSIYPDSVDTDTFGHLFKSNYLYHSLKKGTLYPIYTEYWYNGMELFRYWPPLSYYALSFMQFFTDGDVLTAFYLFAGAAYLLNMTGWLFLGKSENRLGMAFLAGNLYFFCPDNIRIFMAEGNVPRIFITSLLPFAFYCVWECLHYKNWKKLVGLAVVTVLITFSHYMIAAMTGISIFIFCAVYSIINREWKGIVCITIDLVCAYLTSGIMLIPGLTGGGLTSQNSEASIATINQWAQEAVKSLNPFFRSGEGYVRSFYFGLVIFVIVLLGVIAANKKTGAGFITTLVIFISTTTSASAVVRLLPMSQVFWMQRFVPMAMCIFFFTLILWKALKRPAVVLFTLAMLLDGVMTFSMLAEVREEPVAELVEKDMSQYLLEEAVEITENRLGILDNSTWGAVPSWYLSKNMDQSSIPYSFGWAYQGAQTLNNIVSINEAAEGGFYAYVFDRLLELGDDTVLVDKSLVDEDCVEKMHQMAESMGYTLYKENHKVWLYHLKEAKGKFGVVKKYQNLAIGEHAQVIGYLYPQFGYADNSCLDEYSLEELLSYEKIYLSGFTYKNKEAAEKLLLELADCGVKIYIDMQHIPENKLTGKSEFLDVYAQYVAFTEKFPVLSTHNGSQFKLDFKEADYDAWNTVYVSGVSERIRDAYYDDVTRLTYVAKDGNPNITFLGFNLVHYYHVSRLPELLTFLNEIFEEEPGQVVESELVPIEVSYEADKVTVISQADKVITGIAALDCFVPTAKEDLNIQSNLLVVNRGTTVYAVEYTDFKLGAMVSVIGLVGCCLFWIFIWVFQGGRNETNRNGASECFADDNAAAGKGKR